jgi:hypothetical protein
MATVTLSAHTPKKNQRPGYGVHDHFSDWLLIAKSGHQVWVDRTFKSALIERIKAFRSIRAAEPEWQFTFGNLHLCVADFVAALIDVNCPTLLVRLYGQKMPMVDPPELGDPDQRLRRLNEWDIGMNVPSDYIWLFSPKETHDGITCWPMMNPASRNFGSIRAEPILKGTKYAIKVYPLLVHTLKSIKSNIQGEKPKTMKSVRSQVASGLQVIQALAGTPVNEMGGFRIEVSIIAPSLNEARAIAHRLPFFEPRLWFESSPAHPQMEPFLLDASLFTKETLLCNANWVHDRAQEIGAFTGDNGLTATRDRLDILGDFKNSFGWNSGFHRPSDLFDPSTWWYHSVVEEREEMLLSYDTLRTLQGRFNDDDGYLELLRRARACSERQQLPCEIEPNDGDHRLVILTSRPFRLKCGICRRSMNSTDFVRWIARLVTMGRLRGLELETPLPTVEPRPVANPFRISARPVRVVLPARGSIHEGRSLSLRQESRIRASESIQRLLEQLGLHRSAAAEDILDETRVVGMITPQSRISASDSNQGLHRSASAEDSRSATAEDILDETRVVGMITPTVRFDVSLRVKIVRLTYT